MRGVCAREAAADSDAPVARVRGAGDKQQDSGPPRRAPLPDLQDNCRGKACPQVHLFSTAPRRGAVNARQIIRAAACGWAARPILAFARAEKPCAPVTVLTGLPLQVTSSTNSEHCTGTYPFQSCCICARGEGWKGWEVKLVKH